MKRNLPFLLGLLLLIATFSCKSGAESFTAAEMNELDELIKSKAIEFEADWAIPFATNSLNQISNANLLPPGSSASRINLNGNPNFLKIKGDSVSAYLPYYGERQFGVVYNNSNVGIQFNGILEDYEVEKDEEKQSYKIRFKVSATSDYYNVFITVFPNLRTYIDINSNQRLIISYQGDVVKS